MLTLRPIDSTPSASTCAGGRIYKGVSSVLLIERGRLPILRFVVCHPDIAGTEHSNNK